MRWFSHRLSHAWEDRSEQTCTCSVRPTAHASRYHALSVGMTQHFFVFVPFDLDIRTWARFLYSAPNRQVSSSYV